MTKLGQSSHDLNVFIQINFLGYKNLLLSNLTSSYKVNIRSKEKLSQDLWFKQVLSHPVICEFIHLGGPCHVIVVVLSERKISNIKSSFVQEFARQENFAKIIDDACFCTKYRQIQLQTLKLF
jgi:hypothetical protein